MGLKRVLGMSTIVSTSAGLAFAAINFLALVQVAALMLGDSAWLAILVAGLLCLLSAANFGELNAILPSAAGIRVWTRQGISDRVSLTFTLMYLTTVLAVIAADSFILAQAIVAGIPAVPGLVWVILFLSLTLIANLRGVKLAGRLQDSTTFALLASLVIVAVMAFVHHPSPLRTPFALGGNFLEAVSVGVFIFVGFEWVTPLAEEVRDSSKIARGMFWALGMIAVAFGLFSLAMTHLILPATLSHSLVPQLLVGRMAFGNFGFWWMLVVTAITAITTFNGSMVSASRLLYALARERSLPPKLAHLSARFVPDRALWLLWAVSCVLAVVIFVTRRYELLINAGAGLEALMYVVAAVSVLGLRRRQPNLTRSFFAGRATPWITIVLFFVLALGALVTPTGIPGPVPWTLVLLILVALAAFLYVLLVVPRLRAGLRDQQAGRARS